MSDSITENFEEMRDQTLHDEFAAGSNKRGDSEFCFLQDHRKSGFGYDTTSLTSSITRRPTVAIVCNRREAPSLSRETSLRNKELSVSDESGLRWLESWTLNVHSGCFPRGAFATIT